MRLIDIVTIIAYLFILRGIWKLITLRVHIRNYLLNNNGKKDFFSFYYDYYKTRIWKWRMKWNKSSFYNFKWHKIFTRLKALFLVLFGLGLLLLLLYVQSTEWEVYLYEKF